MERQRNSSIIKIDSQEAVIDYDARNNRNISS